MRSSRYAKKRRDQDATLPVLLENVLASLGEALVLIDLDDRITLFNQAAQELTGISEAHALGRTCAEVFAATPAIDAAARRTVNNGKSQVCNEEELRLLSRSVPVRFSCSPILGVTGEQHGVALVIQDLSYLKKLEEEARRNETLARLGGLVAGLAHEIKNPLGGIRGAAQLLAKHFVRQPEVESYTGVMIREIDRLSRLVEQLLTLGSPPAPGSAPVNVHKVLRDVVTLLAPEIAERKVTVRLEIDPSLPEVPGDEAQLTQVFLNLIKNALEAMDDHGTLTIVTRMETDFHIMRRPDGDLRGAGDGGAAVGPSAAPGKFQRIEIADTGPGFAPSDLQRVFEPFFTRKARGTGLGLAICERIVAAHGGGIKADNRRRGGAVVTVTLPAGSV
ncbi:ATP-binding protein [Candidatus Binatia bacterium]|nr:ATP-binding protein [Candidatus Binatia bacterium]